MAQLKLSIICLGLSSFVTDKQTRGPDACEKAEGISALLTRVRMDCAAYVLDQNGVSG